MNTENTKTTINKKKSANENNQNNEKSINNFYRAFEDKYRGSRDVIKQRLTFYLNFINPLKDYFVSNNQTNLATLDLGCGRGEFIELMSENNLSASGIDLDEGMLKACHERGFNVEQKDALTKLKETPSNSVLVISAFHVVEHIPFEYLQELVKESYRVLMHGGLLILETPNPENILVSTCNFYLDYTHQKPIPPQLLSFIAEYNNFEKVKVVRLQEDKNLLEEKIQTNLWEVLTGVSPDYSIVAQKESKDNPEINELLNEQFNTEFGLSLGVLTHRHQGVLGEKLYKLKERENFNEKRIDHLELKANNNEQRIMLAEQRAVSAENQIFALLNSRSWKITQPLRTLAKWSRLEQDTLPYKILATTYVKLKQYPKLLKIVRTIALKIPILKKFVPKNDIVMTAMENGNYNDLFKDVLNPRSKIIYAKIMSEIEKVKPQNANINI